MTIAAARTELLAVVGMIADMVRDAFRGPSGRTTPRMPMLAELAELFAAAAPED